MDQELDLQAQNELLAEELTSDELRAVLDRLGSAEFQLNDFSTVRDVVEGTGADPVEIGRALAGVRKQDFDERFADAFGNHEKRISRLEQGAASTSAQAVPSFRGVTPTLPWSLTRHERRMNLLLWKVLAVLTVFALGLYLLSMLLGGEPLKPSMIPPKNSRVMTERDGTHN